jgi:hypothetical protein
VVKWNTSKNLSLQDVKTLTIKNHFKQTWYGFKNIYPFHWSFLQVLGLVVLVSFDLIE